MAATVSDRPTDHGICKTRYVEAWERRHDYDLYCVLARQFWPMDPHVFRAVDRPGKKLFLEIDSSSRKIVRMWKTWWPFRKVGKANGQKC